MTIRQRLVRTLKQPLPIAIIGIGILALSGALIYNVATGNGFTFNLNSDDGSQAIAGEPTNDPRADIQQGEDPDVVIIEVELCSRGALETDDLVLLAQGVNAMLDELDLPQLRQDDMSARRGVVSYELEGASMDTVGASIGLVENLVASNDLCDTRQ